jgi:hypothetical protein
MVLGRAVEGRPDPGIEADRDEKPIAEVAEEQRIAEKSYLSFICDPPLLRDRLRGQGTRPFDGVRRIHRKTVKRITNGYRDEAYFFLKIRAAFPGNP